MEARHIRVEERAEATAKNACEFVDDVVRVEVIGRHVPPKPPVSKTVVFAAGRWHHGFVPHNIASCAGF